jgi:tryptophan synthase alpha chain
VNEGRIARRLSACRCEGRRALIPFFTAGFPSRASTQAALLGALAAGCDIIELGVPFSDPLADGPSIQRSSQAALDSGVDLPWVLEQVQTFRAGSETPVLLMGYFNPLLQYGLAAFCRDARSAGVDGLIVPDLPPEEGEALRRFSKRQRLSLVYMIAPTSTDARIRSIARRSTDICYCVSLTGVTGARLAALGEVQRYLRRVRRQVNVPIVLGFGISTPAQVRRLAPYADGLVVGSALVPVLERGGSARTVRQRVFATLKPLVRAAGGR